MIIVFIIFYGATVYWTQHIKWKQQQCKSPWKEFLLRKWYFHAAIKNLWNIFFEVRNNFTEIDFKTFFSFPVENSKKNKDILGKDLTHFFSHKINNKLASQSVMNYCDRYFVFAVKLKLIVSILCLTWILTPLYTVKSPKYRNTQDGATVKKIRVWFRPILIVTCQFWGHQISVHKN